MDNVRSGKIIDFFGSWGSGISIIRVLDHDTNRVMDIPCENAPTVRALASLFPGIVDGHVVNVSALKGRRILYERGEMGILTYIGLAGG